MLNLTVPVNLSQLNMIDPDEVIKGVTAFCAKGQNMHPDSLKAVVFKMTQLSRNLDIKQADRDTAAMFATQLANAAIKTYGKHSEFCMEMLAGVQAILNRPAAA